MRHLFGNRDKKSPIVVSAHWKDIIDADWERKVWTKKSFNGDPEKLRISWVIPPVTPGSGGLANIFRFIKFLENQGHECKIYLYGVTPDTPEQTKVLIHQYFEDIKAPVLEHSRVIEDCDALISTGWASAYGAFSTDSDAARIYFIQDFEPLFYPVGSEYILAENTYRFGYYGITLGEWLTKKVSYDYGMKSAHFDFAVDTDTYFLKNKGPRKRILFYARPSTPRRGFELGVMGLSLFSKANPDFEICFFGADRIEYEIPFKYTNLGILSPRELNEAFNQSCACLLESLTNMSLLPFELLSSGCIPVINVGDNNQMVRSNDHLIFSENAPSSLARALARATQISDRTPASESVAGYNWEEEYKKALKLIEEYIKNG